MIPSPWIRFPFVLVLLALCGSLSAQQSVEDRFRDLEDKVQRLQSENQELRTMVDELSAGGAGGGGGDQDLADKIDEISRAMVSGRPGVATPLFDPQKGLLKNLRIAGEWRTRADVRSNAADLLDELDDDGFRLDFRFNLGFGFDMRNTDSSSTFNVRTWFEVQSAGRAANNTSENLASGIGGSIEDFATRDDALDIVRLYQAYILLENMFEIADFNLKVGRQELVLGSGLIMGTNEFFTGFVHDAIRVDFTFDAIMTDVTLFYAKEAAPDGLTQPGLATGGLLQGQARASGDEDELMGLYSTIRAADPLKIDLYYLYFNGRNATNGVRPDNTTSPGDSAIDAFGRTLIEGRIHTIGTRFYGDDIFLDGLFLNLEFAYQFGDSGSSVANNGGNAFDAQDLGAMLIEFRTEYKLPVEADVWVYGGYYFAEGSDSDLDSGFTPFFISRHSNELPDYHAPYSRFGNMDLIPAQNVHVFQLGFRFKPIPELTLGATYLYAMQNHSPSGSLAAAVRDEPPFTVNGLGSVYTTDRSLGHEVDLYGEYEFSRQFKMFFNLSVFVPETDFAINQVNAPAGQAGRIVSTDVAFAAYVQLLLTF